MHTPTDYHTAENLARLKVSVDKTIDEKHIKYPEKDLLYKLIEKLVPQPAPSGSVKEPKSVSAFQPANESRNNLFAERAKLRDEIRSLKSDFTRSQQPQGPQFPRQSSFPRRDRNVQSPPFNPRVSPLAFKDGRIRDWRPTCYRCGVVGHIARISCYAEPLQIHDEHQDALN